jgi:chromosome segregation ATPase
MANMANITLQDLAVGPPNSPGGLHAEASAPSLQPVLALITQGLNMHATRLDALARALARLERGALQQVESAEMARAEAERRAAEAYAHASEAYARAEAAETHAEAQLQAAVQASEGRTAAKHIALERRLAELEARLDTLPPALEELRGRSSAHELVLATHEREIATERSERTAEISEQREAHAALSSRVDQNRADAAAALAAAQESNHAAHARLRETLGEHAERQRRHEARTSAVEEALPQHQEMIEELQQAHSTLQRAVTAEAAEAEKTRAHMAQLATVQAQLEQARSPLIAPDCP